VERNISITSRPLGINVVASIFVLLVSKYINVTVSHFKLQASGFGRHSLQPESLCLLTFLFTLNF